jgi:hypothetical protein
LADHSSRKDRELDCLAGVAAALAQVFARAELASGVERTIAQSGS